MWSSWNNRRVWHCRRRQLVLLRSSTIATWAALPIKHCHGFLGWQAARGYLRQKQEGACFSKRTLALPAAWGRLWWRIITPGRCNFHNGVQRPRAFENYRGDTGRHTISILCIDELLMICWWSSSSWWRTRQHVGESVRLPFAMTGLSYTLGLRQAGRLYVPILYEMDL